MYEKIFCSQTSNESVSFDLNELIGATFESSLGVSISYKENSFTKTISPYLSLEDKNINENSNEVKSETMKRILERE